MSSVQFYETRAGRQFYESTMPSLVAELARLNTLLEELVAQRAEHSIGEERGRETERP